MQSRFIGVFMVKYSPQEDRPQDQWLRLQSSLCFQSRTAPLACGSLCPSLPSAPWAETHRILRTRLTEHNTTSSVTVYCQRPAEMQDGSYHWSRTSSGLRRRGVEECWAAMPHVQRCSGNRLRWGRPSRYADEASPPAPWEDKDFINKLPKQYIIFNILYNG